MVVSPFDVIARAFLVLVAFLFLFLVVVESMGGRGRRGGMGKNRLAAAVPRYSVPVPSTQLSISNVALESNLRSHGVLLRDARLPCRTGNLFRLCRLYR
jgi:hypothetical protein